MGTTHIFDVILLGKLFRTKLDMLVNVRVTITKIAFFNQVGRL
jgi:hypothetical protein